MPENTSLQRLSGQIERVTYTNSENGYTIAKVKVYGRRDLVTVVGNIVDPTPGAILKMSGEWSTHPRYGEQFKVVFYETAVPATVHGIEKYLGSGLIKGIGPVMAKRIVKLFGEKTLDVIEHEAGRLVEVPGIGKQRVEMIQRAWEEQKDIRDVMLFLQSQGVSSGYASKIYKAYGKDSIKIVKENPYRLAYDIYGIGFLTADKIAEKLGFEQDSPLRAEAGLLYALHELSDEGHVYYPTDKLLDVASDLLKIEGDAVLRSALDRLRDEKRIVSELIRIDGVDVPVTYLAGYHLAEVQAASRLRALLRAPAALRSVKVDAAIGWAEEKSGLKLAERQREAVAAALTGKVMVITGGPGTGKTTILKAILSIYGAITPRILLAAPTGRAAKRMSEATCREAKTIHRLLVFDVRRGAFKKNEDDPLDCDLLVLDEVSMVDLLLFHHLLKAVPKHSKLILVGDTDQLPSVGAGRVLQDIIESGAVPVVRLNEIFRQARQSAIITNAHRIIQGQTLHFENDAGEDMFFIEKDTPEDMLETVIGLVKSRLPRRFGLDPFTDIQVLAPMNRGNVGTAKLNEALQTALNPNGLQVSRGSRVFRVGDKVMQIRNDYDREVFNGDIGVITGIDAENQEVTVEIDGVGVSYDFADLDELVLAYAVSIHKAQGAEYPAVIIPLSTQHYVMLQRNLLYTGVTRGKRLVVLVGTKKALNIAIKNNKIMQRYSGLARRLWRSD
ncbi:MAG: ATP-dependent RecD-like DNA helicase [Selenomonas sp.]|nr:ATP-dependent RecD-like DNA helicase [Selenomonas sp.]